MQQKWRRCPQGSTKRVRRILCGEDESPEVQKCVGVDDMRWTRLLWDRPNGIIQTPLPTVLGLAWWRDGTVDRRVASLGPFLSTQ